MGEVPSNTKKGETGWRFKSRHEGERKGRSEEGKGSVGLLHGGIGQLCDLKRGSLWSYQEGGARRGKEGSTRP